MERRFINTAAAPVSVSKREDGAQTITGYGAVFYDGTPGSEFKLFDDMIERIMPTAFDRAVKEDDVRGLFNHNPDHLLGRTSSKTMTLSVDAKGLRYVIEPPATSLAADVVKSIERGDLSGSSFAFIPTRQTWREDNGVLYREIDEVQLFDVGPVTFPAYEGSTTGLRSATDAKEARAAGDAWRAQRASEAAKVTMAMAAARARAVEVEG